MSNELRLISINVERSRHLERVVPFLVGEQPDVVCVQELMHEDIKQFEVALDMHCTFAPMTYFPDPEERPRLLGVGVFSRLPMRTSEMLYYWGSAEHLPVYDRGRRAETSSQALVVCEVEKERTLFKIATTHFPVTQEEIPLPDAQQREAIVKVLELLNKEKELVFVGDINSPRGGEIFTRIAAEFTDNIPPQYTTSLDGNLHRVGAAKLAADAAAAGLPGQMVDGLFTTPSYTVHDVRLQDGVSDHMAIVATISKQ